MTVVTWNVNSIRARAERLFAWLAANPADVVCLQELKVTAEDFPFDAVREAGYTAQVHGQRTYNGVAILSRAEPEEVERGFGDGGDDTQARLIAARILGVRVVCAYVPNGQEPGSEKYAYKLAWLGRLRAWLDRRFPASEPLLVAGDFNVAPEERDVARPGEWDGSVLYNPEVRAALEHVRGFGLEDVFRRHHREGGHYSWWDYRMLGFAKGNGLRIDHILASRPLARRSTGARIDREARKGKQPSDHAPVVATFSAE